MLWQNNDDGENDTFDSLDDNCCYEIMRRLPLDDLCTLSQTCVRLHNLSVKQFQLDYPAREMHIEGIADDGKLMTGPKQEKYIAAFEKCIRNIVLHGDPLVSKFDVLSTYYKQDETMSGLVKHIRLIKWSEGDFTNAGQTLAPLLKDVETIVFDHVWIGSDWYDTILKYTPNIKCLTVLYRCIFNQQQNWLEHVYPNLESFQCYGITAIDVERLKDFLQLNPTVRHVSLYTRWAEDVTVWTENGVKVDELFFYIHIGDTTGLFEFEYDTDFLKSKVAALNDLTKAQNTMLHLMIGDANSVSEKELIAEISLLKSNVVGLYLPGERNIGKKLATAVSTFENLRVLLIGKCTKNEIIAQLPKLEELFIQYGFKQGNFDEIYQTVRTFVAKSATLNKIYIQNDYVPFTRFDFADLDRKRMQLTGARKLKIYIDSKENDDTGKLDDIGQTFKRIEIIRTAIEPPNNPLLDRLQYGLWNEERERVSVFYKRKPPNSCTTM